MKQPLLFYHHLLRRLLLMLMAWSFSVAATNAQNGAACYTFTASTNTNHVADVFARGDTIYTANAGQGLGISTDNGQSFSYRTTAHGLVSNDARAVWSNGNSVFIGTSAGLSISTDGGVTFVSRTTANGLGSNNISGIYAVGNSVYVATDAGLSISTNGGGFFSNRTTANGLASNTITSVTGTGTQLFVGTNMGLNTSSNGGTSFSSLPVAALNLTLNSAEITDVFAENNSVIVGTDVNGIFISNDGGAQFYPSAGGLGRTYGVFIMGSTKYAATSFGLALSTNNGPFNLYNIGLPGNYMSSVTANTTKIFIGSPDRLSFCAPCSPQTSISITSDAPSGVYCENALRRFTANITNRNSSTSIFWYKNGNQVHTVIPTPNDAEYYDNNLQQGDQVWCEILHNDPCLPNDPLVSNIININISPNVTPLINLSVSPGSIITPGTNVTFTANPTNGGANPTFQWLLNGSVVGTNSPTFSSNTLADGDQINCTLTSSLTCITTPTVLSSAINIVISSPQPDGPTCASFVTRTTANGLADNALFDVFVSGNTVYAPNIGGLSRSTNGGSTFTSVSLPTSLQGFSTFFFVNANTFYASNFNNVFVTNDGGANFTALNYPGGMVQDVHQSISSLFIADYNGLAVSSDNGQSFTYRTTADGLGSNDVGRIFSIGSTIFCSTNNGLSISSDNGQTFVNRTTANGLASNSIGPVFASGTKVYVATPNGLSISTNGGQSFVTRTTAHGLPSNYIRKVVAQGNIVYVVCSPGFAISTDGGLSFVALGAAQGLTSSDFNGVAVSSTNIFLPSFNGLSTCSACSPNIVPSVTLTTNTPGTFCSGTSVTFTASPVNGGSAPIYQWKKNGNDVGSNSPTYTDASLQNNDMVSVTMTSNHACAFPFFATSNSIQSSVTPSVNASVSITSNQTSCAYTTVTFTANPINGGSSPIYQWKKNGNNVGTNSATYVDGSLTLTDEVSVVMTSNAACINNATVNSNTIRTQVAPTISIVVDYPSICAGTTVNYNATITHGGITPHYQWKINGNNVGSNSPTFSTNSIAHNDQVTCVLTSSVICATAPVVTSNAVTMSVTPTVTPAVVISAAPGNSIMSGTSVTFTATTTNSGTSPIYQWKKNGSNVGSNSPTYTDAALDNGHVITCELTSNAICPSPTTVTSNAISMNVTYPPGAALRFDGSNDFVALPSSLSSALTGGGTGTAFTIEYWFRGSSLQSAVRFQSGGNYIVAGWNNQHILSFDGGTSSGLAIGAAATNGDWHHVAITWQKNTPNGFKSYLDGVLVAQRNSANANMPNLTAAGWLGCFGGTSEFTNGTLDEVRIWNRALDQCQIQNNMNCELSVAAQTGLLAYYRFNQGNGTGNNSGVTSLIDSSGNNRNATLNNFALNGANSNWVSTGSVTTGNACSTGGVITPSVSISTNNTGAACQNASITFTANPTNGGTSPTYQWKKNGANVGSNAATYTDSNFLATDEITVVMTSSLACINPTSATSNGIVISSLPALRPRLALSFVDNSGKPNDGFLCNLTATNGNLNINFNAAVSGGSGVYSQYNWTVNGTPAVINSGSGAAVVIVAPTANNNVYAVLVTDANGCTATSSVTMPTFRGPIINMNDTTICAGQSVTLTPAVSGLAGGGSAYTWQDNSTATTYTTSTSGTYTLTVRGTFTGCINSKSVNVTVLPVVNPSVTIAVNNNAICSGTNAIFTATPINQGTAPVYQWVKNGNNVGANSPVYSDAALINGDEVSVVMTSNRQCLNTNTANSNSITMLVTPSVTPTVSLVYNGSGNVCPGNMVSFTANSTHAGTSPTYEFSVNGNPVQNSSSNTYSTTSLVNGDVLTVQLTANNTCQTTSTVVSSPINAPISNAVNVSMNTIGTISFSSDSILLSGTPAGGVFSGPGVSGNWFRPWLSDTGMVTIQYAYTSPTGCSGNTITTFRVLPDAIVYRNGQWEYGQPSSANGAIDMVVNDGTTPAIPSGSACRDLVLRGGNLTHNLNQLLTINRDLRLNTGSISGGGTLRFTNANAQISTTRNAIEFRADIEVASGANVHSSPFFRLAPGSNILAGINTPNGGGSSSGIWNLVQRGSTQLGAYNAWSSPIVGGTGRMMLGSNNHRFNASTQSWESWDSSQVMTPGRGYIATNASNGWFRGTLHDGNYSIPVAFNGTGSSWNLIGNPYPSQLSLADFLNANPQINGTAYFMKTNVNVNQIVTDYSAINGLTVSLDVPVSQGFFVEANAAGNASFTNSMRRAGRTTFFQRVQNDAELVRIKAEKLNAPEHFNTTLIGFKPDATAGFDRLYDGRLLKGNTQILVASIWNNEPLAIQGLPSLNGTTQVPLSVEVTAAGSYQLSLDSTTLTSANASIYLEDAQTGVMHNLRNGNYSIQAAQPHIWNNRFKLWINPMLTQTTAISNQPIRLYAYGQTVVIDQLDGRSLKEVKLTDLTGRAIHQWQKPQGISRVELPTTVAPGIYLLTAITADGRISTERVVIGE